MRENGKLCILRLSAIGDVCHAVALVQRIQSTRPDIEITWVIGKIEYQLVADIPGINFVIFDKKQGKKAFSELKRALRGKHFDVLFLMQVALRANIASMCIKAKQRFGFDKERSKELHGMFTNRAISKQIHPHVLDGFMAFADAAGIPAIDKPRWHIPIPQDAQGFANELKQALGEFCIICPSASKAERNWTVEGYQQISAHLAGKGLAVVLCGGPAQSERELAGNIAECGHIAQSLVGKTSLKQLLAVLSQAKLVLAPDTGPAHMATTVGTPVVGLYAHSNPLRTGPYNSLQHTVSVYETAVQEQHGKPWQQLRWGTRAKGENLMSLISPDAVIERLDGLL